MQTALPAVRRFAAPFALAALLVTLAPIATPARVGAADAVVAEKSLYERLGGIFAIAAVVDHFSDALIHNPIVGQTSKNPALREWHTQSLDRFPGLKFMRTLWVAEALGLEEAHRNLKISSAEFDEVAAELVRTLDHFKVPAREKGEVLAAFAAHKGEVTAGSAVK